MVMVCVTKISQAKLLLCYSHFIVVKLRHGQVNWYFYA